MKPCMQIVEGHKCNRWYTAVNHAWQKGIKHTIGCVVYPTVYAHNPDCILDSGIRCIACCDGYLGTRAPAMGNRSWTIIHHLLRITLTFLCARASVNNNEQMFSCNKTYIFECVWSIHLQSTFIYFQMPMCCMHSNGVFDWHIQNGCLSVKNRLVPRILKCLTCMPLILPQMMWSHPLKTYECFQCCIGSGAWKFTCSVDSDGKMLEQSWFFLQRDVS